TSNEVADGRKNDQIGNCSICLFRALIILISLIFLDKNGPLLYAHGYECAAAASVRRQEGQPFLFRKRVRSGQQTTSRHAAVGWRTIRLLPGTGAEGGAQHTGDGAGGGRDAAERCL